MSNKSSFENYSILFRHSMWKFIIRGNAKAADEGYLINRCSRETIVLENRGVHPKKIEKIEVFIQKWPSWQNEVF